MKKILILYVAEYRGHKKAALNIEEALHFVSSDGETEVINAFRYLSPRTERLLDALYIFIVRCIPKLWGKIYDRRRIVDNINFLRKIANKFYFRKLKTLFAKFTPDIIINTQAFPCIVCADYKHKYKLNVPVIGVITDYYPHRFWVNPYVDYYIVPTPEAKDVLVQEGIREEKIYITGIPISVKFLNVCSHKEVAEHFGFDVDKPTILIMGGGLGIGPIKKIVEEIDCLDREIDFQVIVVCGKNRKLYEWCRNNKERFRRKVFYFGYIDFVNQLMDFSNIIITKAGGITLSEALCKGLGIIIVNPIPGQEERNVQYLIKKGAVVRVNNVGDVGNKVKELLLDRERLYSLKIKAKENSLIDSSLRIADFIMSKIKDAK